MRNLRDKIQTKMKELRTNAIQFRINCLWVYSANCF